MKDSPIIPVLFCSTLTLSSPLYAADAYDELFEDLDKESARLTRMIASELQRNDQSHAAPRLSLQAQPRPVSARSPGMLDDGGPQYQQILRESLRTHNAEELSRQEVITIEYNRQEGRLESEKVWVQAQIATLDIEIDQLRNMLKSLTTIYFKFFEADPEIEALSSGEEKSRREALRTQQKVETKAKWDNLLAQSNTARANHDRANARLRALIDELAALQIKAEAASQRFLDLKATHESFAREKTPTTSIEIHSLPPILSSALPLPPSPLSAASSSSISPVVSPPFPSLLLGRSSSSATQLKDPTKK